MHPEHSASLAFLYHTRILIFLIALSMPRWPRPLHSKAPKYPYTYNLVVYYLWTLPFTMYTVFAMGRVEQHVHNT